MLEDIYISNFAIIDAQTVPFAAGFNVMSGETGAGKSILIDALGLQLGDRADSGWIRHGSARCDIQSTYRFDTDSRIQQWLVANEFDGDEAGTCQLRRTLSQGGKSKCYINAIPTTARNTKQLGEMLVDIHGQHAHQSLMSPDSQLELLDNFANHPTQLATVKAAYQRWQKLLQKKQQLQKQDDNLSDKRELLGYQLEELTQLQLQENEFATLSDAQKQLSSANDILTQINRIEQALDGENSVNNALNQVISLATQIAALDERAEPVTELFNQAFIYLDEGRSSLQHYAQSVESDPERLFEIDARMSTLHAVARKHRVEPDELLSLSDKLQQQLTELDEALHTLSQIDADIVAAEKAYRQKAEQLSRARQKAAKKLSRTVMDKLAMLNLENARFDIVFKENASAKRNGIDRIVFVFAPNLGQGEKPLHRIASGGELSRISLAIQVAGAAAQRHTTLIFDEVDSGIGGATAEVVGRLLKTLSQFNQVICVTHLAQVAAFADRHIEISKSVKNNATFTHFQRLDDEQRLQELARMSGGINPDKKTLAHAQELRNNALQFSKTLTL